MPAPLEDWIARQYRFSAQAMLEAVSATQITQIRPGFGQTVTPIKGSIVASPVLAAWDPDPDYFFHWFRDSAVVIDAIRVLHEDGTLGPEALGHFGDFVTFSLSLPHREPVTDRAKTKPDFAQYLRPEGEITAVSTRDVAAETRVNPDGTLDISRWSRPQHDGPALRLIAVLRWLSSEIPLDDGSRTKAIRLANSDIDFILRHLGEPAFDMWEEEQGQHYYTLRAEATALARAASWLQDAEKAEACRAAVSTLHRRLDGFWREKDGFYSSRLTGDPTKYLDISVIFAVIHADDTGPLHSIRDVRMLATLRKLEKLFDGLYVINQGRPENRAPAMGRFASDVYFSGGAYYFSTLAAAEFYFRFAAECTGDLARNYFAKGDAFLETVRAFTPESGELSEQFDRNTGQQVSAKKLAWSYAAFVTAIAARNSCDEVQ
ncbi:glycoside hydrolase family 15 protein [Aestuariivirga sp. YIM B02566]|uniref:glycoside hydrolase family 15 protein n=1 Tax=Taklimakanibacter albus TaxID=2800327 RepID=UPI001FEE69E7|nr:glycoside hydrolase family 15 protein [Aestuariivirga sp. YIM B02566]